MVSRSDVGDMSVAPPRLVETLRLTFGAPNASRWREFVSLFELQLRNVFRMVRMRGGDPPRRMKFSSLPFFVISALCLLGVNTQCPDVGYFYVNVFRLRVWN